MACENSTPWTLRRWEPRGWTPEWRLINASGQIAAIVASYEGDDNKRAQMIVHRVNNFEALEKALFAAQQDLIKEGMRVNELEAEKQAGMEARKEV